MRSFVPMPLPPQPPLYLSLYLKQYCAVYYDLLDRVRTHGDWEAWIEFFLEGVEQTANGAVHTAQRLVALFQQDAQCAQASGRGAANALRVLAALRHRPLISVKQLCGRQHDLPHRRQGA